MFRKAFTIFFLLITTISSATCFGLSVTDPQFGAVGDSINDDTQPFVKAWEALCSSTDPKPTLLIPQGKTFKVKQINFNGPCKSNSLEIQILGTILAPYGTEWTDCKHDCWLCFHNVDGLILSGHGTINGNADFKSWWKHAGTKLSCHNKPAEKPAVLDFQTCNNLRVMDLTSKNSPLNHMSISGCNGVSMSKISLIAPEESPNTDGIDISKSQHVDISDSWIGTGDDCVAINGGTSDVNITRLDCGPGHGISVGSLGKNGRVDIVEEIHVRNSTFTATQNGARIKTWPGGSGYARSISFEDIILDKSQHPIVIDQHYCDKHAVNATCSSQETSAVAISDVTFSGFRGTSADHKADRKSVV